MSAINEDGKLGWYATGLGAAMISGSFILMLFGVSGAIVHNFLQLGGLITAILGYFLFGGRKYQMMKRSKETGNSGEKS